jgi:phosphoribosylaminoimidazole-succinocarboxamide synthase
MTTLLYEGKAKKIFSSVELPDCATMYFKDDATAFNNEKKSSFEGKGELNCWISQHMFELLGHFHVPTHYVRGMDERRLVVKLLEIIPIEVICRNVAAGSFCKRYGISHGKIFKSPIVEYCLKDDDFGDPLINSDAVIVLGLATREDLKKMKDLTRKINVILHAVFRVVGLALVDFKLEFGKDAEGNIYLADEICPDTVRLWDTDTGDSFDKDLYRYDTGDLLAGYKEVKRRLSHSWT